MAQAESDQDEIERELEEAKEYRQFVIQELRKREHVCSECEMRVAELEREAQGLRPHRFVQAGDAALIRTISESRKENARRLSAERKKLKEMQQDIERAKERLVMANEDLENLKQRIVKGVVDSGPGRQ